MRIVVPIIAIIILAAPAAMAGHPWSGAGWYHVVEVSAAGRRILKTLTGGPFADESSCLANLPRDYTSPGDDAGDPDEFNDYSCLFLSSRPDWDD
jgi:hypothetical protein